eukprot:scaffold124721_cov66-Phaeocystis_antarctica.AAC.2
MVNGRAIGDFGTGGQQPHREGCHCARAVLLECVEEQPGPETHHPRQFLYLSIYLSSTLTMLPRHAEQRGQQARRSSTTHRDEPPLAPLAPDDDGSQKPCNCGPLCAMDRAPSSSSRPWVALASDEKMRTHSAVRGSSMGGRFRSLRLDPVGVSRESKSDVPTRFVAVRVRADLTRTQKPSERSSDGTSRLACIGCREQRPRTTWHHACARACSCCCSKRGVAVERRPETGRRAQVARPLLQQRAQWPEGQGRIHRARDRPADAHVEPVANVRLAPAQRPPPLQLAVSAAVHCQRAKALRRNVASLEVSDVSHSAQRRKRLRWSRRALLHSSNPEPYAIPGGKTSSTTPSFGCMNAALTNAAPCIDTSSLASPNRRTNSASGSRCGSTAPSMVKPAPRIAASTAPSLSISRPAVAPCADRRCHSMALGCEACAGRCSGSPRWRRTLVRKLS